MKSLLPLLLFTLLNSPSSWAAREHNVQVGDHVLDILISNKYPMETEQQKQHWLDEMMRLNHSKFIWGEIDLIKPGSVLTLPAHPGDLAVPLPIVSAEFDALERIAEAVVEQGHVDVQTKQGAKRKATGILYIYEGDTLITSSDALAKITMIDQAKFELGANSKISFERYQYHPKQPEKSATLTRFYRGVMRATTGLIGKFAADTVHLRTPVATIGIRGTDYIVRHCEGAACGEYSGSSLAVVDGGIATQTKSGSVDLDKDEFVLASSAGDLSPVTAIPEGFLDLSKDVAQLESPLNWWQKAVYDVKQFLQQ